MNTPSIKAVRGMHDILPDRTHFWQHVEGILRDTLHSYGYQEIRFPLVESTALFKRSIGEVTDIVEKEMYSFDDRNGDSLTLRPEGTAGCVRAAIENGLINRGQTQRLWYQGPMFRHERPQKGRYRQFHQLGVESYGFPDADMDLEMLLLSNRLLKNLGLERITLELNSLGSPEERQLYRQQLSAFWQQNRQQLDEDGHRRMTSNPLRILDSKNPQLQELIEAAPKLWDSLGTASRASFEQICAGLQETGIPYRVNPRLVRGLDYYAHTVFEWTTDQLGAQGTVCAGGRYDQLVAQLGGPATSATGFALGLERLIALLEHKQLPPPLADLFLIKVGEPAQITGTALAERLRDRLPMLQIINHCGGGSFKSQLKKADKSGARFALILAEQEVAEGRLLLKPLRGEQAQQEITLDGAVDAIARIYADPHRGTDQS